MTSIGLGLLGLLCWLGVLAIWDLVPAGRYLGYVRRLGMLLLFVGGNTLLALALRALLR